MTAALATSSSRSRSLSREAAIEQNVRRLVARELHDRVTQTLTEMLVELENFKSEQVSWEDVLEQLEAIQRSTRLVLSNLRQLLHDLRGEDQSCDDFVAALSRLIARFEETSRINVELNVRPGWPDSLTRPAFVNLYRIVEEALSNVRMYSGAQSVRIVLEPHSNEQLALLVDDDGRGLDTELPKPMGLGMVGMKERAIFLGGQLRVESEPGRGTKLHAVFPLRDITPRTQPRAQLRPERATT